MKPYKVLGFLAFLTLALASQAGQAAQCDDVNVEKDDNDTWIVKCDYSMIGQVTKLSSNSWTARCLSGGAGSESFGNRENAIRYVVRSCED